MQNKLITTLCSGLLAFALTSCDMIEDAYNKTSELDAPVLSVTEQFSDGFTISWPAVQNAAGYRYVFETEAEQGTTDTSLTFSNLDPGTYTVKVKAVPVSSEWTESGFTTIMATVEAAAPSKLKAPVLSVTDQSDDGFTVSWQAVEHAADYSYVFGNDAEQRTTDTSVTFGSLEPGTYTVQVKAVSDSAEWTDSDFASVSATIEAAPEAELTITIDVTDITANSATITCIPSDNSRTYYFAQMEKSVFDQYYTSDEAFSAILIESMKATGEASGMTLEEVLELMLCSGPYKWTPGGLLSSTEYVVYALGIEMDGTISSSVMTQSYTTEAGDPEVDKWFGNWEATTTGSLKWDLDGGYLIPTYEENSPMSLSFSIITGEQGQILLYGWSQVDSSLPALCEVNENGDLEVYAGISVGSENQGYIPTWSAYCSIDADFGLITGTYPAYTFRMSGDRATSTRYEGSLSSGESIRVVSLEIYALSDNQYAIYGQDFPSYYVAGDITMTKVAGVNSTKLAMALRKAQKSVAPGRLLPSSYVLTNMRAMN